MQMYVIHGLLLREREREVNGRDRNAVKIERGKKAISEKRKPGEDIK